MALFRKSCPKKTRLRRGHLHRLSVFISASRFHLCSCLKVIEKVCLWPHRLLRGNGSGNVCCLATVESEKGAIWREQVGPCVESGWITFKDRVRDMVELQGASAAPACPLRSKSSVKGGPSLRIRLIYRDLPTAVTGLGQAFFRMTGLKKREESGEPFTDVHRCCLFPLPHCSPPSP